MTDIIKDYGFSSSIFKKNTKLMEIQGAFSRLEGSSTKIDFSSALKASLGEFTERLVQLSRPKNYNGIVGYDVMNEKSVSLEYSDAFLLREKMGSDSKSDFADSSGTAFFTNTDESIRKAMFEFVERQSLVYSFLCEWPGHKIDNLKIKKAFNYYNKFNFSTIYANDISIVNGISIVIFVGLNSNSYNVGLGADYNQFDALKKAISEGMGTMQFSISNEEIENREKDIHQIDKELSQCDPSALNYSNIFFNRLTPTFIEERFHYLTKGTYEINKKGTDYLLLNKEDIIKNLKYIGRTLSIDPTLIFIGNGPDRVKAGSVVKVTSRGCYPHIFTPFIEPEKYSISYKINKNPDFCNEGKYLPFP